jgi:CheY-like chemotaxis protein
MYNILVAEDDELDRMNIQRAFDRAHIVNPLLFAIDGVEALKLIDSNELKQPAIILLDINMPRMNGMEFLQILRNKEGWQNVPVIVLTTSSAEKDIVAAYNLKISGYVVKPMEFTGFIDAITTIESYWALNEFPT